MNKPIFLILPVMVVFIITPLNALRQAPTREDFYIGINCDVLVDMVLEIECMQYQTEQIKKSLGISEHTRKEDNKDQLSFRRNILV